jgi:hypothetical protein
MMWIATDIVSSGLACMHRRCSTSQQVFAFSLSLFDAHASLLFMNAAVYSLAMRALPAVAAAVVPLQVHSRAVMGRAQLQAGRQAPACC